MPTSFSGIVQGTFEFVRSGSAGGEIEWLIRSRDGVLSPQVSSASGAGSLINYSLTYGAVSNPDPGDNSKEDVVATRGSEEVTFYRRFRTFTGKYVCHCHNLAHEDHAMMFGWTIV